jgi:murein DD-endopeptidase MepM/ murein hydrolase activator NlpD
LNTIIPALGIAGITACFFFVSTWTLPSENAGIIPQEDIQFQRNLAAYAGILPESAPAAEEGELQDADIPLDLIETFAWKSYTVKNGDSISKIAVNHALSMDAIIASNGITNARRLYAGQVIRIPNMDGIPYTVKKGDSFSKISSAMDVPLSVVLDANDIQSDEIIPGTVLFIPGARMRAEELRLALGELFIYPIRGRLTDRYGWRNDPISGERRFHAALDLASPTGTPIKAAMDGRAATVGYNSSYGNFVILDHGNGYQTLYAHMSKVGISQGSYTRQGNKIGEVGSTGYSTGPHLHFAIYKNKRAVNPLEFLNGQY